MDCGRHPTLGISELGCWMCGFEDFLYRLAGDPEFVHRLFSNVIAYLNRANELNYGAIGPSPPIMTISEHRQPLSSRTPVFR